MKSLNIFRFNCDRLWKLWYSLIVIFIILILICLGISNYTGFKSQSIDPRFGNQWSKLPSNFQLFSIVLSLSLFVLFIYSCIFKVENIANDGVELGIDPNSIDCALKNISFNKGVVLFIMRLKTHLLPYNCLLHVIIALLLALPLPLMQAEQIKNEAVSSEFLWSTDIYYLIYPQSSNIVKRKIIFCAESKCEYPFKPSAISPEFLNLLLSLLILTVRISSPFWYTNKAFAIIFSLFTFLTAFSIVTEYELLLLFVKIVHNKGSDIVNVDIITRMSVPITLILSFIKSLCMLFMLLIIFEYGYTQYIYNMRKYRQYFATLDMSDSVSQQSNPNQQIKWYQIAPRLLGAVTLLAIIIIKIYLLLAFMDFYFQIPNAPALIIFNLGVYVIYFIISTFLWFGLCIKSKWQFHINIQTNPIPNIGPGKLAGSPEPIYGFFHATSSSSQNSLTKPIFRSSIDGSENSSFRLQSVNYVMMQPGGSVLPIQEMLEYNRIGSEVSYGSQTKSVDSNDHRYRPYNFQGHTMDGSQYATLASVQSGVILPPRALSDTSSNDTVPRSQSRRISNRVTFKEQLDQNPLYPRLRELYTHSSQSPSTDIPDILSTNTNTKERQLLTYSDTNSPHGFDPDLEMSTDMRQGDNSACVERDPRLCSQV